QAENEISSLSSAATLSTIVSHLNMLASSLPSGFASIGFTSDYRGAPSDSASTSDQLEALINVQLAASASASIPIDLGAGAQDVGLSINGNLAVNASLTGNLTFGLTTESTPKPFLVPSQTLMPATALTLSATTGTGITATASADTFAATQVGDEISFSGGVAGIKTVTDAQHVAVDILSPFSSTSLTSGNWSLSDGLTAGVHASVNPLSASVKLGFLSASISNGSIDFSGTIHIGLTDPKTDMNDTTGEEITLSELG